MKLRTDWDQLLGSARSGDVQALGRLVESASEDLRAVASAVLGPTARQRLRTQSEDVFADAIVAAVREISRLRATSYLGFRYWFATIARNQVRRSLRGQVVRPDGTASTESDPEDEVDEVILITDENVGLVRTSLVRLPRSQQVAFVLRQGFGLAWRSVGFVLEQRDSPAARLLAYRASATVKGTAQKLPEIRCLPIQA
jgi:RNA polymerase sigma factor (sigma-70 family)